MRMNPTYLIKACIPTRGINDALVPVEPQGFSPQLVLLAIFFITRFFFFFFLLLRKERTVDLIFFFRRRNSIRPVYHGIKSWDHVMFSSSFFPGPIVVFPVI